MELCLISPKTYLEFLPRQSKKMLHAIARCTEKTLYPQRHRMKAEDRSVTCLPVSCACPIPSHISIPSGSSLISQLRLFVFLCIIQLSQSNRQSSCLASFGKISINPYDCYVLPCLLPQNYSVDRNITPQFGDLSSGLFQCLHIVQLNSKINNMHFTYMTFYYLHDVSKYCHEVLNDTQFSQTMIDTIQLYIYFSKSL